MALNSGERLPFGDGPRCAGGPIKRLQVVITDGSGQSSTSTDLGLAGVVQAGDTRVYQLWFRDPVNGPCGSGFNLTNRVEVVWAP